MRRGADKVDSNLFENFRFGDGAEITSHQHLNSQHSLPLGESERDLRSIVLSLDVFGGEG